MSKCRLKMYRVRIRDQLAFYCTNESHDNSHGPHHPRLTKLTRDSVLVDPDELYATMRSTTA